MPDVTLPPVGRWDVGMNVQWSPVAQAISIDVLAEEFVGEAIEVPGMGTVDEFWLTMPVTMGGGPTGGRVKVADALYDTPEPAMEMIGEYGYGAGPMPEDVGIIGLEEVALVATGETSVPPVLQG
ncbi:hypothetical protein KC330_g6690 [Hortaea werneckii]|nr:hypothetical protein KC330_g6690 [Hortaea werneckii]